MTDELERQLDHTLNWARANDISQAALIARIIGDMQPTLAASAQAARQEERNRLGALMMVKCVAPFISDEFGTYDADGIAGATLEFVNDLAENEAPTPQSGEACPECNHISTLHNSKYGCTAQYGSCGCKGITGRIGGGSDGK